MNRTLCVLFAFLIFTACKKKEDVKNPCDELKDQIAGTYEITVTTYPLQTSQEGETKEVLVSPDINCYGNIEFNNLFQFFSCSKFLLTEKTTFEVTYEDNATWAGALVEGRGSIINGIFHFEGTVLNRGDKYPIVLDGKRASRSMRTSPC